MDEIFDRDKARWFKVKRGFFGRLILQEQIYTKVRRFPGSGQLSYSDCEGLYTPKPQPIPPHLRPSNQTARDET
jgi:hypothetical protein